MSKRDLYIKAKAPAEDWNRPSDWLPMPTGITSTDQIFVGLHAVIEDSDNFCAFRFTTSAGQYEVDWGDGTIDLVDSNVTAEHQYDFTNVALDGTLTSRGYKQAMITVTPVSGNLLTCNFQQRFTTTPAQTTAYSTGFLDCILSMPNASSGQSIIFGGASVRHTYIERANVLTIGTSTNLNALFQNCHSLQSVPLFNTQNVTSMVAMFQQCHSLEVVPLFDTGLVNSMASMLNACFPLKSIPNFNLTSLTNISGMVADCRGLQSFPELNTSSVTNFSSLFFECRSLNSIPPLSTAATTTSAGTDFGTLFASGANSLNRCQMVFARTVSFNNCQLSRDAIVEIFNNLVDRSATTSATITITGNWGVPALSSADLLTATNKNWVVIQ